MTPFQSFALSLFTAAMVSVIAPAVLSYMTGKQRMAEKKEDYRRQDEVAAQAREAARLLLDANERVAETTLETNKKLEIIHTLVNSNMTSAIQEQLDARRLNLVMMEELIDIKQREGHDPSPDAIGAVLSARQRIEELTANLADRARQSEVVAAQEKGYAPC